MNTDVMFSSKTDRWSTPQWLFDRLNNIFCFTLDVCADETNHKCDRYFAEHDDGLKKSWGGERAFCNPPYGRQIGEWVKKASETVLDDKSCVVMLLPARTDTKWFHDYIANNSRAHTVFLKGRLKFGDEKHNAPFPSMIVVFA